MRMWQHRVESGGCYRWRLKQVGFGFVIGNIAVVVLFLVNSRNGAREEHVNGRSPDVPNNLEGLVFNEESINGGDDRLARYLNKKVRILCWIMIRDKDNNKAKAIRNTWCKRCDSVLFFGRDSEFQAIDVINNVQESTSTLAVKTFASLTYIYRHHLLDFDWFLKADDDTFVVMENLRYFLSDEDPLTATYFGEYFNPSGSNYIRYNSGGAGYVMSRETLRRFGVEGSARSVCRDPFGAEDRALGYCLLKLGVELRGSRDRFAGSRFHAGRVAEYAVGGHNSWYRDFVGDRYRQGVDSISDLPISFHHLLDYDIYFIDFLIYRLRPFGIVESFPDVNN